jgi:hypothetical protein
MVSIPKPRPPKTLSERIVDANADLKAARRDGGCAAITEAARTLDDLIDLIPRKASA